MVQDFNSAGSAQSGSSTQIFAHKDNQQAATSLLHALQSVQSQIDRLDSYCSQLTQAKNFFKEVPKKIRHEVMLPIGSEALIPAKLVRTNEVLVLLGDDYFVKRSCHQTQGIIDRRIQVVEEKQKGFEGRKKEIELVLQESQAMADVQEDITEIMEPLTEEDEEYLREAEALQAQLDNWAAASDTESDDDTSDGQVNNQSGDSRVHPITEHGDALIPKGDNATGAPFDTLTIGSKDDERAPVLSCSSTSSAVSNVVVEDSFNVQPGVAGTPVSHAQGIGGNNSLRSSRPKSKFAAQFGK